MASVAREPARELDAVHVAFVVAVDQEPEVERVSEDLALNGKDGSTSNCWAPWAPYDFAETAQPES